GRGGGRGGEVVAGLIFLRGGRDRRVSAARRALGLGGWRPRCRRRAGASAWAGGYVGVGGAPDPRPGRVATSVEAVRGALVRDAVNPSRGARARQPCRLRPADGPPHHPLEPFAGAAAEGPARRLLEPFAGAAAEGSARRLPGPSPALVGVG